jgi:hypothetical protein
VAASGRERALLFAQALSEVLSGSLHFSTDPRPGAAARAGDIELSMWLAVHVGTDGSAAQNAITAAVALTAAGHADEYDAIVAGRTDLLEDLAAPWYDGADASVPMQQRVTLTLRQPAVRQALLAAGAAAGSQRFLFDAFLGAVHGAPLFCASFIPVRLQAVLAQPRAPAAAATATGADAAAARNALLDAAVASYRAQVEAAVTAAQQAWEEQAQPGAAACGSGNRVFVDGSWHMVATPARHARLAGASAGAGASGAAATGAASVLLAVNAEGVHVVDVGEGGASSGGDDSRVPVRAVCCLGWQSRRDCHLYRSPSLSYRSLTATPSPAPSPSTPLQVKVLYSAPFSHVQWHAMRDGALVVQMYAVTGAASAGGGQRGSAAASGPLAGLPAITLVLSPLRSSVLVRLQTVSADSEGAPRGREGEGALAAQ